MPNIRIQDLEKSTPGFQMIKTDVAGVPGYTVINTGDIPEGGNLYFTQARARAAITGANGVNYDPATGIITIQPIGIESDPIFTASPSFGITTGEIAHWNTAFGWGNHATAGYTVDATLITKVNYSVCHLLDISSASSVDWNARVMKTSAGLVTIDWGVSRTYDGSSIVSIDWANRFLIDDSNVRSINWGSRVLLSSTSTQSLNWETGRMFDNTNLSLDWVNRVMYYHGGIIPSIEWNAASMYDQSGHVSIDYNARRMYNASGVLTFDWNTVASLSVANLNDASAKLSVDVYNRALYYTDGTTRILDWLNGFIYDNTAVASITFTNRILNDAVGNISLNWGLRTSFDQANIESLDWNARHTFDINGIVSMDYDNRHLIYISNRNAIDWQNGLIRDDSVNNYLTIDWTGRHLNDVVGGVSVDYGSRELKNSAFSVVLDWQNGTLNDPSIGAIVHWGVVNTRPALEIKNGCFLQIDDVYTGSTLSPSTQIGNTNVGYGDTTVGVLGKPSTWFKIQGPTGALFYVPAYLVP